VAKPQPRIWRHCARWKNNVFTLINSVIPNGPGQARSEQRLRLGTAFGHLGRAEIVAIKQLHIDDLYG
jgi:hypothetical protein